MSIITGKYKNTNELNNSKSNGKFISNHVWVDKIKDKNQEIYNILEKVRDSDNIKDIIQKKYTNYKIKNVKESDEIYFAVSPKDAIGSDRSLVDCHYDAPFSILPNFNIIYYRVIIACNENKHVTTMFPNDNINVKMNTGDFHGLDYNKDYHCADGEIPQDKNRVLLKLHYILVPNEYQDDTISEKYVRFINLRWTYGSREFMRMSARPNNIIEYFMGFLVNFLRFYYNNISLLLLIIFIVYGLPKLKIIKVIK
jgi:hypothetical protein